MHIRLLTTPPDLQRYDAWVRNHPQGSLWQSLERKRYWEACGKQTRLYALQEPNGRILASALIHIDRTSFGVSTWECGRGPLWGMDSSDKRIADSNDFLKRIIDDAKQDGCMTLYVGPSVPFSTDHWSLTTSPRHVYPEATRIIDLTVSEEEILRQMKPKGRYNIAVAERHDVIVEQTRDAGAFHTLMVETADRDGFKALPLRHYQLFLEAQQDSFLLLASTSHNGQKKVIAGLTGITWNGTGIYYYGASSYEERALMAPYLLQWKAMKLCKASGCFNYDLLGVAPASAGPDHPWTGITSFKEKFGGEYVEHPEEKQMVLRPYMKGLLDWKRRVIG